MSAAGELLSDSYEAGYLDAAFPLAQLCAAIGVDATGLLADARQKEAERAASSPPDTARDWQHRLMTAPGADGSITPSAMPSLLNGLTSTPRRISRSVRGSLGGLSPFRGVPRES